MKRGVVLTYHDDNDISRDAKVYGILTRHDSHENIFNFTIYLTIGNNGRVAIGTVNTFRVNTIISNIKISYTDRTGFYQIIREYNKYLIILKKYTSILEYFYENCSEVIDKTYIDCDYALIKGKYLYDPKTKNAINLITGASSSEISLKRVSNCDLKTVRSPYGTLIAFNETCKKVIALNEKIINRSIKILRI